MNYNVSLVICATIAFISGAFGLFLKSPTFDVSFSTQFAYQLTDLFYKTLLLFVFEAPKDLSYLATENRQAAFLINLARFLGPISLAGTIFKAASGIWRPRYDAHCMRKLTDHTIVLGSGRTAKAFITSALAEHREVVAVVSTREAKERLKQIFPSQLMVFVGETDLLESWRCVAANRASHIFLTSITDRRNIVAMKTIGKMAIQSALSREEKRKAVRVFTCINNNELRDEYVRQTNAFKAPCGFHFEPFSPTERAARRFFQTRDFFYETKLRGYQRVHWLVFGVSTGTIALLNQFLRISPHYGLQKPKLTLVGSANDPNMASLIETLKCCESFVSYELIEHDWDKSPPLDDFYHNLSTREISSVLISELRGRDFEVAIALRGRAQRDGLLNVPIYLSDFADIEFNDLILGETSNALHEEVSQIGDLEEICHTRLLDGESDRLAQQFHNAYIEEEKIKYDKNPEQEFGCKEAHKPWSQLDENFRRSNRRAADHAKTKCEMLEILGPLDVASIKGFCANNISKDMINNLSICEHDSWHIDRLLSGWRYGRRDEARRRHNNLVPFDKLDEGTQLYDLEQVQRLLYNLQDKQTRPSTMFQQVTIGLIGNNRLTAAQAETIQDQMSTNILPELESKYPNHRLTFLSPLAPGSDLILSQCVSDYFLASASNRTGILGVHSIEKNELVSAFLDQWEEGHTWSLHHTFPDEFNELETKIADQKRFQFIESALNDFQKERTIIDLYNPNSADQAVRFEANANYFAWVPNILIACIDKSKKSGKSGTAQTIKNARANGVVVLEIKL